MINVLPTVGLKVKESDNVNKINVGFITAVVY